MSSEERRNQVVDTALALLADTPLDQLTTRQIARAVGVSQPALFRHFRSRDDIVLAVVERVRQDLGALAATLLDSGRPPLDLIDGLVRGVLSYATEHPGMPRLLFRDMAGRGDARIRAPLSQIVSLQRNLLAELIRQARRAGNVPAEVDVGQAARLILAMVQGIVLQWQLEGRPDRLLQDADSIITSWRAAVQAGVPAADSRQAPAAPAPAATDVLTVLDVRPILAGGVDPLDDIRTALDGLRDDGALVLMAPFRPVPLLRLLSGQGYTTQVEDHGDSFVVTAAGPTADGPLDLRDLPAPEPLEQVLLKSTALVPGASFLARVPRVPQLLLPRLTERGMTWRVVGLPDGSALLHVSRPA